jgi:MoaA/NifB/PqqE/SkfB family radical SAM enzyme
LSDPLLFVSPFVREKTVANRAIYYCADPVTSDRTRGRGIARSEVLDRLLLAFRDGAHPDDVVESSAAPDAARSAIENLVRLGFLRTWEEHRAPEPSFELEITALCNADCVMCPRDQLRPQGQMQEDVFEQVVKIVGRHPERGVIVQGIGEPTLHRSLSPWVRRLRAVIPAAPLIVVTNGIRMTPQLYGALIKAGVTEVQWSLHAVDPGVATEVFGTHLAPRALANLEACLDISQDHLEINFVLMDRTRQELSRVREWLGSRGLPSRRLRIIPVFDRGGTVDTRALFARIHRTSLAPCVYVRKSIFIAWNGDALPCSNDIAGGHVYGNVLRTSGEELVRSWRADLASTNVGYDICRTCDHHSRDSMATGWLAARSSGISPGISQ